MEAIIHMLDPDQHKKIAWLHTEMKSLGIEAMELSMLTWPDYTADFIGVYGEAIIRIAQELHSQVLELLQIMTEEERQAFADRCYAAKLEFQYNTLDRLADSILAHAMNATTLDLDDLIRSHQRAKAKAQELAPDLHALLDSDADGLMEVLPEHHMGRIGVCIEGYEPPVYVGTIEDLKSFNAEHQTTVTKPQKHVFYHPLILNYLNTEKNGFTAALADLHESLEGCRFFVAVNYHLIAQDLPENVRKAREYGTPYDRKAILQSEVSGMTVYVPDNLGLETQTDSRFEIFWNHADDSKRQTQIQTENIKKVNATTGEPVQTGKYILTHYFHAIFDPTLKCFTHMDGAIKFYTPGEFTDRYSKKLDRDQHKNKIKLFRIDGRIPMETFERMFRLFYPGNPCVQEYLNNKKHHDPVVADSVADLSD